MNVIDLPAEREERKLDREPKLWFCDCGCVTFYHWSNGAIQCACDAQFGLLLLLSWLNSFSFLTGILNKWYCVGTRQ